MVSNSFYVIFVIMTGKAIFETFPRDMYFVLYFMICGFYIVLIRMYEM